MPARYDPDEARDDRDYDSEHCTSGLDDVTNGGYQIFFSARDWFKMFGNLDDWYGDPLDGWDEEECDWGGLGDDDGDGPPKGGGASASVGAGHEVTIYPPPGEHEGNEDRYELGCARCDYLGSADTFADAEVIARLHEAFVATLIDKWDVDREIDGTPDKGSFKVTCPDCGEVGSADNPDTAELLTRLHARAERLAAQAKEAS